MRKAPIPKRLDELNTLGFVRNSEYFWKEVVKSGKLKKMLSEKNIDRIMDDGYAPLIDATWVKYNKACAGILEQAMKEKPNLTKGAFEKRIRLIHHHIDHGPMAVIVPEVVHSSFDGFLHPLKKVKNLPKVHIDFVYDFKR